jgi:ABC-type Fe3+-siderophore transport system permease subunit
LRAVGADAVEAAIKLAKTATGRSTVCSFSGGYHGMTQGTLAAAIGSGLSLLLILTLARRSQYSPQRLLLAGSTYQVSLSQSLWMLLLAVLLGGLCWAASRWLNLLGLGAEAAQGLGLNQAKARLGLLTLAALLTASATLLMGPLSFIGLMAPHMARLLGAHQVRQQLLLSSLLGAILLVLADWLGRNLLYPFQMPAGLLVTLVGGLYFLFGLRGSRR